MDLGKVGKFIAELRKEKKLTQAQLGEKVGVTDKTVSKWEQGICAPNISILNELSEILGITTTELLNGKRFEDISKKELADTTTKGMKYYINLSKKSLIKKMFIAILVTIILAISIIAFLFFKNNYDNCYVYELSSADPNYTVKGIIVEAPDKSILILNSVENNSDTNLLDRKIYAYEYMIKIGENNLNQKGNISLYSYEKGEKIKSLNNAIDNIKFYEIEKENNLISKGKVKLIIRFINEHQKKEEKIINLETEKIYINNKIRYNQ